MQIISEAANLIEVTIPFCIGQKEVGACKLFQDSKHHFFRDSFFLVFRSDYYIEDIGVIMAIRDNSGKTDKGISIVSCYIPGVTKSRYDVIFRLSPSDAFEDIDDFGSTELIVLPEVELHS